MRSKAAKTALGDIIHHIDLATNLIAGLDEVSFSEDVRTVYAVTRCALMAGDVARDAPEADLIAQALRRRAA